MKAKTSYGHKSFVPGKGCIDHSKEWWKYVLFNMLTQVTNQLWQVVLWTVIWQGFYFLTQNMKKLFHKSNKQM